MWLVRFDWCLPSSSSYACASHARWVSRVLSHALCTCAVPRPITCPASAWNRTDEPPYSLRQLAHTSGVMVNGHACVCGLGRLASVGHAGVAGLLPYLFIRRVKPRLRVEKLGTRIELVEVDQSWREFLREVRAVLPGANFPSSLNRKQFEIPEALSNLGAGVIRICPVNNIRAVLAASLSLVLEHTLRGLVPLPATSLALVQEVVRLLLPYLSCRVLAGALSRIFAIISRTSSHDPSSDRIRHLFDAHRIGLVAHLFHITPGCRLHLWICVVPARVEHHVPPQFDKGMSIMFDHLVSSVQHLSGGSLVLASHQFLPLLHDEDDVPDMLIQGGFNILVMR